LPDIFSYFISGFIFLKIFNFQTTKQKDDISSFTLWCVIISFIIKSTVSAFDSLIIPRYELIPWVAVILYIVIGMGSSIIATKIYESKRFKNYIAKINNKSLNNDVWKDIIDYEGTTVKVFLKDNDIIYTGKLITHEERGNESWFIFKDFVSEYNNSATFDSKKIDFPSVVAINLQEISRMELFYSPQTKIFD